MYVRITTTTKSKGMNVSLTPELEQFAKGLVDSGRYNSRSEVVRDALRLLEDQERLRELKLEALREKIQEGLESGPATEWDIDEFLTEAHRRHEEGKVGSKK